MKDMGKGIGTLGIGLAVTVMAHYGTEIGCICGMFLGAFGTYNIWSNK